MNYRGPNVGKVYKYGFFSGQYFPVIGLNTGKNSPEKTQYLNTFLALSQVLYYNTFRFEKRVTEII